MQPDNSQYNQPGVPAGQPSIPDMTGGAPSYPQQGVPQQPQAYPQQVVQPQPVAPQPVGAQGAATTAEEKETPKNPNSTQNSLQLSEIRDSMVIMNDGSFRAVIACKSINFDLMSSREREGVEYSYQNFINSLNFPVQILVRSQRVDIGPYIEKLVDTRRSQDNMLLGVLMDDYINFIDTLAEEANIMEKSFYITVPFFPEGDLQNLKAQAVGFFGKLFAKPQNTVTKIDSAAYQKAKDEIANRVNVVQAGLFQIGVQSAQLDTRALGELYYSYYNPDTALRQPLGDFENIATTFVKKAEPTQGPTGGVQ
ncbi:hypothetical protein KI440_00135 [Candidatus Saccharibacteria bacterium TM7i]|nr:hypothetical protein KI440_00135 [Candidatus Saccharibacteria bacterium TM7i]